MPRLTTHVSEGLGNWTTAQWSRLFADYPDPLPLIRLTEACPPDGFGFYGVTVRDGEEPVLYLPLFDVRFDLSTLIDGRLAHAASVLRQMLPRLMKPRILAVGFAEGEWGAVGRSPTAGDATLADAWISAQQALASLARDLRASIVLFSNFTGPSLATLPCQPAGFTRLDTYPYGILRPRFGSVDGYLASLSKSTRKSLRRKMKGAAALEVRRTTEIEPWLDAAHAIYTSTVDRSDLSFGSLPKSYFSRVCDEVPGAGYVMYLLDGRLIAFNLLIEGADSQARRFLLDKFFAMDPISGREHDLWFISWLENVRYCIEREVVTYYAGSGSEATKARLGAELMPGVSLFRHRNPAANLLLRAARPLVSYRPEVDPERMGDGEGRGE